jgi:hypothetical protein
VIWLTDGWRCENRGGALIANYRRTQTREVQKGEMSTSILWYARNAGSIFGDEGMKLRTIGRMSNNRRGI